MGSCSFSSNLVAMAKHSRKLMQLTDQHATPHETTLCFTNFCLYWVETT